MHTHASNIYETDIPLYIHPSLQFTERWGSRKFIKFLANRCGLQPMFRKTHLDKHRYRIIDAHQFMLAKIKYGI